MVSNKSSARRWAKVGLIAFIVIDVALVAAALGAHRESKSAALAPTVPLEQPTEATPTPSTTPAQVAATVAQIAPPPRLMAAYDSSTVWRTESGSCPGAEIAPELSTDGGATWSASVRPGASAILGINAISGAEASMVTLSVIDCSPELVATYVAGDQWRSYPDRLVSNWYVDPANRAIVHSPVGEFAAPCMNVIAIAARDDSGAGVLCDSGMFLRTVDAGASWGNAVETPGALNLNVSSDGYIIALADQPGCIGVQVSSATEAIDGSVTAMGCNDQVIGERDVAVASSDGVVWMWVGDVVSKSTSGGVTWG